MFGCTKQYNSLSLTTANTFDTIDLIRMTISCSVKSTGTIYEVSQSTSLYCSKDQHGFPALVISDVLDCRNS